MAATGETYTKASTHVRAALTDLHLDDHVTIDVHGKHGQTVVLTSRTGHGCAPANRTPASR